MSSISAYIDHTLLRPACTQSDIKKICEEAIQYKFAAACVPPSMLKQSKEWINGSAVKLATVIGFPFGYSMPAVKFAETAQAIHDGADELDIVINLIALKSGDWNYLEKEMGNIIQLAHAHFKKVKIIIESGILTNEEIVHCCLLYSKLGADFLKTSTGYAEKGATVEAVRLMRENLPANINIKASGGIKTYNFAMQLIEAGASRIGCSASIEIVKSEVAHDLQN